MRSVELGKVAVAAETLRLKRMAMRHAMRIAYGVGAALFGLAVCVLVHVVGYLALRLALSPISCSLIVLAVDVVAAVVFGVLMKRNSPGPVEMAALQVRKQALVELPRSLTILGALGKLYSFIKRPLTRPSDSKVVQTNRLRLDCRR